MKRVYGGIALLTFIILGIAAHSDDSQSTPEKKFVEIRKFCGAQKKPGTVCACLVKNLRAKFTGGQFGDQQLNDAVKVMRHSSGDDTSIDYMADLLTGIEFHCMENSNYSGD